MPASKAFVLYVWDNIKGDVVGLFRAVGPGVGAQGRAWPGRKLQRLYDFRGIGPAIERWRFRWPRQPLPRVFDITQVRDFAARLSVLYPEPRYAIRDWLANSLEDFFVSRYRCDEPELAIYRRSIADPFSTDEISAVPIPLCDYQRWNPTGIESGGKRPGIRTFDGDLALFSEKSGHAVLRKDAAERDMRSQGLNPRKDRDTYAENLRAKGYKLYRSDPDLPSHCVAMTAFNFSAQELIFLLAEDDIEVKIVAVAEHEKELRLLLSHCYPQAEIRIPNGLGHNYYLEGPSRATKKLTQIWIGTHRLECLRAFGTDRLCADIAETA